MTYTSLAVIGTAGRKDDRGRLTAGHYARMVQGVETLIAHLKLNTSTIQLISGGAAWADHVVVSLALNGIIDPTRLLLFLPTELSDYGYRGTDEASDKTASTCNFYHQNFSKIIGRSSIDELLEVRRRGAVCNTDGGGFHARNAMVAKSVNPDGVLIAYTFGDDSSGQVPWTARVFEGSVTAQYAGLKDGGTAHTFGLAKCLKYHGRLGPL